MVYDVNSNEEDNKLKNQLKTQLKNDKIYEILSISCDAEEVVIENVCRSHLAYLKNLLQTNEIRKDRAEKLKITKLLETIRLYQTAMQLCAEN